MKKFKYFLLLVFWSFGNFVIGKCPDNSISVEGTKFKEIYGNYSLVFDAYKREKKIVMSTTVNPFFKSYVRQIENSIICLDKKELRKCITDFKVISRQADDLPDGTTKDGRDRLEVLKTVIDELQELETSISQKEVEKPSFDLPDQPKTESPRNRNESSANVIRNPDDQESVNWAWFVAVFFGLTTLGLGFWLWKLLDKQDSINLTLRDLSDKLNEILNKNDPSYRSSSYENQLQRIEFLVSSLQQRSSIFNKENNMLRQELEKSKKESERLKKVERDLVVQIEATNLEYDNYKTQVAKSMGNKHSFAPEKLNTFPQNFEQPPPQATKLFYLSYPSPSSDGMGEFYDKRQQQPNSTNSYYKFEIDKDEVNAKFWFYDTAGTVEGATRNPDTYLSPACDYPAVDPKAKRIITKKEGIAKRMGDVWKVYKKAVIEFS